MPVTTIASSTGAPIAGFIRDTTGSYLGSFQLFLGLSLLAFLCIVVAKPPVHPSLKAKARAEQLEAELERSRG